MPPTARALRTALLPLLLSAAFLHLPGRSPAQNHFGGVWQNQDVWTILSAVSQDSLQKYVKQLSGVVPVDPNGIQQYLVSRASGSGNFLTASDFIAMQLAAAGLTPVKENNSSPWNKLNVVGTLPGAGSDYVVVCGHFDAAGSACPGADDNASGTAVMLEAARVLKNFAFQRTIKFVAFGGEEQGLLGSAAYVQAHAADSIRAVVNCDMVMWDGDADMVLQVHGKANGALQFSSDLASYVRAVDSAYSLPPACLKVVPGLTGSDHSSFWNAGRSAVCLIEEYGSDFNPYYHSSSDTYANASAPKHQNFFFGAAKVAIASVAHLAGIIAPVPVELASFAGEEREGEARLRWRTASETNNAGFTVERMRAGERDYRATGFVPGAGTSALEHSYEFREPIEPGALHRYRLRQTDIDGAVSFSPVVEVAALPPDRAAFLEQNYPNPFGPGSLSGAGATTIAFRLKEPASVRLEVLDCLGRTVAILAEGGYEAGRHAKDFIPGYLPAGMYYCRLAVNGKPAGTKLINWSR